MQFPEDFKKFEAISPSFGKVKDDSDFWTSWVKTAVHNINDLPSDYPDFDDWDAAYSIAWGGLNYALDKKLQSIELDDLPKFASQVMEWLPPSKDQMILNYKVVSYAAKLQPNDTALKQAAELLNSEFSLDDAISERLGALQNVSSSQVFEENLEAMAKAFLKLPSIATSGTSTIRVEIEGPSLKNF